MILNGFLKSPNKLKTKIGQLYLYILFPGRVPADMSSEIEQDLGNVERWQ